MHDGHKTILGACMVDTKPSVKGVCPLLCSKSLSPSRPLTPLAPPPYPEPTLTLTMLEVTNTFTECDPHIVHVKTFPPNPSPGPLTMKQTHE